MITIKDKQYLYETENPPRTTKCFVLADLWIEDKRVVVAGRGVSNCNISDRYNYEFGEKLAKTRAMIKFYKKVERILINYSYELSAKAKKKERASVSIAKWHLDELHKYLDKGVK